MARTFRLLALSAPGSIEAEIGALQQAVFADHGFVSAIALPPLVPVRFLPLDGPSRLPQVPGREVPAGFVVTVAGPGWHDGHLFLGVDTSGAWPGLRRDERFRDGPALFPCREGFYLGCAEAGPEARDAIRVPAADRRFTSLDLVLVTIEVPDGDTPWWDEVRWQVDERRPLRGKVPRAPQAGWRPGTAT